MASSSSSPCAACKFLRRKCTAECVFAPYFPPDQPHKFANVHKIFGASNITKLLNELPPHQREDAVNSLAYEADARVKDPVYGCVGAISLLQRQVAQLQNELAMAHSDLARYAQGHAGMIASAAAGPPSASTQAGASSGGGHQGLGSSSSAGSLGIGMGLPGSSHHSAAAAGAAGGREGSVVQQQMLLTREQLIDLARDPPQLTREQIMELARVGGGSYEAGLAALGLTGALGPSLGQQQQYSGSSRTAGGGESAGSGSHGGGAAGAHHGPHPP